MKENSWTLLSIVKWGTEYFKDKGIDSPRLTIELMLCKLLNINRINIYTQFDKPLNDSELKELKLMIKRRLQNEPLQYIIGRTSFYGLNIEVNKGVLIPRPETELLVLNMLNSIVDKEANLRILDIGTGSGCIAIALAKFLKKSHILAIDISKDAVSLAEKNANSLYLNNINFETCNILTQLPSQNNFDFIVSNPPYIEYPEYKKLDKEIFIFEPMEALTDMGDGLKFYKRYAEIFPHILDKEGNFFLEIGFGQFESVKKIFLDKGLKIKVDNDFNNIPRVISLK